MLIEDRAINDALEILKRFLSEVKESLKNR